MVQSSGVLGMYDPKRPVKVLLAVQTIVAVKCGFEDAFVFVVRLNLPLGRRVFVIISVLSYYYILSYYY